VYGKRRAALFAAISAVVGLGRAAEPQLSTDKKRSITCESV
jgi:hypothetical protein